MSDLWLELHVLPHGLQDVYNRADALGVLSIHHFSEPWVPGGWAVRVLLPEPGLSAEDFGVPGTSWDASPDENLFNTAWPEVRAFFEASSRLALKRGGKYQEWYDGKVIHCALNAWGYEMADEQSFAWRLFTGRLRMRWHCFWRKTLKVDRPCKYGCHKPGWSL